jgi:hypothetical protein
MSETLNITRPDGRKVAIVVISCDEIDALRAKLAESEAACASAVELLREQETLLEQFQATAAFGRKLRSLLQALPASVLSHMEEDAALREVRRYAANFVAWIDSYRGEESWERPEVTALRTALAAIDAARAKNGGG